MKPNKFKRSHAQTLTPSLDVGGLTEEQVDLLNMLVDAFKKRNDLRAYAVELLDKQFTPDEIAHRLGVSRTRIAALLKE